MQAPSLALALALAASPALAAHCPHGQLWRVHLDKCVPLGSTLALAYAPAHAQRIKIELPTEVEPPIKPDDLPQVMPDPVSAIPDIPLTDADPAKMALKLQLETK